MAEAKRDQNHITSTLFTGSDGLTYNLEGDKTTGRIYVDIAGGSGTVTSVSVVSANGFAGTVATATTTPAITLSTTLNTPVIAGNGTALVAATTTGSGSTVVLNTAPTFATSITGSYLDASEILITDGSKNIVSAAVATYPSLTELTYVKGVTSAIQTQLNAKGAGTVTSVGFTGGLISVANPTTTPAFTVAGTSGGIPYFSSTSAWASSGLLAANAIVIGGGAGTAPATTTTGTGVLTALGVNVGSAGAFVTFNGALGTPSSGTLTNATGLPAASIVPGTLATGAYILSENASIQLDPAGSADGKYTGITVTAVSDYTQAFGDLVYLKASNSRWAAADADAATTAGPVALAMVVATGTSGNACTLLLQGIIRADAAFPTMTVGATQYVGETAGAIQGAIPTGADNVIRTVGYAMTADELYFNPSTDWQVTVA